MIEAHVGLPGSGKSLHLVKRLLGAKKEKKKALANFHCQTDGWEFVLWDRMLEAKNCIVAIDEAQMWFSSRKWAQQDQGDLAMFQQHRKEGLDLVWCAQHESRVDVAVREVTAFIWRHKKLGRFVIAKKTTPEEPKVSIARCVFMITPSLYQHFFTEEVIGFRDGSGYRLGSGEAYRRNDGMPADSFDEHLRIRANYYRIELPGNVIYRAANSPFLSEEVGFALCEWRGLEHQKYAGDIVQPLYRGADGRFHELDLENGFIANQAHLDLLQQAEVMAKTALDRVNAVFCPTPHSQTPASLSRNLNPNAAIGMVRARSVAQQGLGLLGKVASFALTGVATNSEQQELPVRRIGITPASETSEAS